MNAYEDEKNEFIENIYVIDENNYQLDPDYGWGPRHEGAQELAQLYDKSKIFIYRFSFYIYIDTKH